MPRPKSTNLTEAELRLMDIIWARGKATVAEVAEALPKDLDLAYNTVLTTLRILEDKGYLKHSKAKEASRVRVPGGGEPGAGQPQRGAAFVAAVFRELGQGSGAESSGG